MHWSLYRENCRVYLLLQMVALGEMLRYRFEDLRHWMRSLTRWSYLTDWQETITCVISTRRILNRFRCWKMRLRPVFMVRELPVVWLSSKQRRVKRVNRRLVTKVVYSSLNGLINPTCWIPMSMDVPSGKRMQTTINLVKSSKASVSSIMTGVMIATVIRYLIPWNRWNGWIQLRRCARPILTGSMKYLVPEYRRTIRFQYRVVLINHVLSSTWVMKTQKVFRLKLSGKNIRLVWTRSMTYWMVVWK